MFKLESVEREEEKRRLLRKKTKINSIEIQSYILIVQNVNFNFEFL